tara:strand:+ start:578 stop:874 length:297 start_codon:yes stop_codon:yes gene_type:complete
MKRRIRMEPISGLEPGSKFTTNTSEDLKGVVLSHGNMGTSVYWYDIPEHYKKKYYDDETSRDERGNLYIGLDTLFYMKKMIIGSETSVIEITDKRKGE